MVRKTEDVLINDQDRKPAHFSDYLAMARLDHSVKHIFIIPGIVLGYMLRGVRSDNFWSSLAFGFVTAFCIASANYVINEWFDRNSDKFHPTKFKRSAVQRQVRGYIVFIEWIMLVIVGLACALAANSTMFFIAGLFAIQGIIYNAPPIRTKDRSYLDVISESINNPFRLMIGWVIVDPMSLPPSSIILAYWLGGAFLMAAKRFSEYREIVASHGKELLTRYRASFSGYSDVSLTVSCFVYGLLSSFFLAVFLIKYRIEYIMLMPAVACLFAYYLALAMKPGSSAQNPEKLFRERGLIFLIILCSSLFILSTFVNIPSLERLTSQRYIVVQ